MHNVNIKNNGVSTSNDQLQKIILNDNTFINAYWKFVNTLKRYNATNLEISFKSDTPKHIEYKKLNTNPMIFAGRKRKHRKCSQGHKPEITEKQEIKDELSEIN